MLLFPSDPLRPRRPDDHFAEEAAAARDAGLAVALVDHDALARAAGDAGRAVASVPSGDAEAVYRGWMLRAERYAAFADALARRGVTLRTTAGQYRRAHELPGWYATLAEVTPRSAWTAGTDRAGFDRVRAELGPGPAVLRDYTKSMKHHWHEAAYVPELADATAAWRVAERFLSLREDDLVGGLVLRRFEPFRGAEVRTWWVDGTCVLVGAHPDTPDELPTADVYPRSASGPLAGLAPLVAALDLPFVTVDLALRSDGVWRVVELGDGQVSDRPASLRPSAFVAALVGAGDRADGPTAR